MLAGLAGGDALEIIVALKDLSSEGFHKLEGNLKHLEGTANATNMGGFSKATKTAEADAAKLAGNKGGGGIAGLASGMLSLAGGPVMIVIGALAAVGAGAMLLERTYQDVAKSEALLKAAGDAHGISLEALNKHIDDNRSTLEAAGFTLADYRDATVKMTEAGMNLATQQTALDPIMGLAKAHNLSLADAARQYELAIMGNQRAVKDLGIIMPVLTKEQKAGGDMTERQTLLNQKLAASLGDTGKATTPLAATQAKLSDAWEKLSTVVGPVVEGFFTFLIGTLGTVIDVASTLAGVIGTVLGPAFDAIGNLVGQAANAIGFVGDVFGNLVKGVGVVAAGISSAMTSTAATTETATGKMTDDLTAVGVAADHLRGKTRDDMVTGSDSVVQSSMDVAAAQLSMANKIILSAANAARAFATFRDKLVGDAKTIVDAAFDKIITGQNLMATNAEIAKERMIIASSKSTKQQVADAKAALPALEKTQADYLLGLAQAGDTGSKTVGDTVKLLMKEEASAHGAEKKALDTEIAAWMTLAATINAVPARALTAGAKKLGYVGNQDLYKKYASGGVVEPRPGGTLAIIGEAGEREWVIPESKMGSVGGSSSTTVHTHIYLDGSVIADIVERHLGNRLNLRGTSTGMGSI